MPGNLTLYQNDPQWKDKPLGLSTDSTIGLFGCLLTSLAMVANAYGADETPDTLNEKMKSVQGFQGPWVRAFMIKSVLPGVSYARNVECYDAVPAPLADIDNWLATGKPVIVEVDYSPDPGVQNHWTVMCGKQGDDYLIRDPWKSAKGEQTLKQRYGFAGDVAQLINNVIFLDGKPVPGAVTGALPKATQPAAPAPKPAAPASSTSTSGLVVQGTVDALTLRSSPQIVNNNVIKYLPANSKLLVLEPEAAAKPKIGAQNQWLKVRDIEGKEGHVAAWLVTPANEPALGPRPSTGGQKADAPGKLTVRTTKDMVTLRSKPVVAEDTVLKTLPLNAQLLVVEAGNAASKIGVQNQWLQVKDIQGAQGYVAAWFVQKG